MEDEAGVDGAVKQVNEQLGNVCPSRRDTTLPADAAPEVSPRKGRRRREVRQRHPRLSRVGLLRALWPLIGRCRRTQGRHPRRCRWSARARQRLPRRPARPGCRWRRTRRDFACLDRRQGIIPKSGCDRAPFTAASRAAIATPRRRIAPMPIDASYLGLRRCAPS